MNRILTTMAVALTLSASAADAQQTDSSTLRTWTGWFSDKQCARTPAPGETVRPNGTACVKRCLSEGATPVFLNEQENTILDVRDYQAVGNDVGYRVEVTGIIDRQAKAISVRSVKRLSAVPASCSLPKQPATPARAGQPAAANTLPPMALTTVDGVAIDPARLRNRPVIVALWATWCSACHAILDQLDTLQKGHPDDLTVIAVAIESSETDVKRFAARAKPAYSIVGGTPALTQTFGTVAAVPTLVVFDRRGIRTDSIQGAPADLRERIEAALRSSR